MPFDHLRNCDVVEAEIARFAAVTDGADASTPVPSCPGWTLADLIGHAGSIHRWATTMVAQLSPKRLPRDQLDFSLPDDPSTLPAWLADGAAPLVATFRAADPDAPMWAWGLDQHTRFWARRMVHETGVHRADAELALGQEPSMEPAVAADGLDELLDNLPCAAYFAPRVDELRGGGEALGLIASDADTTWRIELHPDRFIWTRGAGATSADVTITASATDLLLLLYGRRSPADDRVTITGDTSLLDRWLESSSL